VSELALGSLTLSCIGFASNRFYTTEAIALFILLFEIHLHFLFQMNDWLS